MNKVLLDTNIILDFALEREGYFESAEKILQLAYNRELAAWITPTTVTNVYYIARKAKGKATAINFIANLIDFIEITNINKFVVLEALKLNFNDFEDAIQTSSAIYNEVSMIITRNIQDFKDSTIPIYAPEEFLADFSQSRF